MTNPFQPAAQPAQGQPNPFGGQGAATPQAAQQSTQPAFQAPTQQTAPPAAQTAPPQGFSDPFAPTPDEPDDADRLVKGDAFLNTVIILRVKATEKYTSKFPVQGSNPPEFKEQTRLITHVTFVTGPKRGTVSDDQWINWYSIVRQFSACAGDGRPYLVQLYMDGNAVKAQPVTDPAVKADAAQYL